MTEREENIQNLKDEVENLKMNIKNLIYTVVKSEKLIMNTSTQLEQSKFIRTKVEEDRVIECEKFLECVDEFNSKLLNMKEKKCEQQRKFYKKIQLLGNEKKAA